MSEQRQPALRRGDGRERVTMTFMPREVRMHYVSETELDDLKSGWASPSLALFGVTFGAAVTAVVTILTVEMSAQLFAGFVGAAIATTCLTVLFGVQAVREYRALTRRVNEIKATRPVD